MRKSLAHTPSGEYIRKLNKEKCLYDSVRNQNKKKTSFYSHCHLLLMDVVVSVASVFCSNFPEFIFRVSAKGNMHVTIITKHKYLKLTFCLFDNIERLLLATTVEDGHSFRRPIFVIIVFVAPTIKISFNFPGPPVYYTIHRTFSTNIGPYSTLFSLKFLALFTRFF